MQENVIKIVLGIFLTALLAAFFASIIPRKLKEREKIIEAANKFRESFTEEIRFINRDFAIDRAGRDIPVILAAAADKHEAALITFMAVLSERKKAKIKNTWKTYTGDDKVTGKYTFRQYATKGKIKDGESIRQLVLSRINNLLKFADPKH